MLDFECLSSNADQSTHIKKSFMLLQTVVFCLSISVPAGKAYWGSLVHRKGMWKGDTLHQSGVHSQNPQSHSFLAARPLPTKGSKPHENGSTVEEQTSKS